MGKKIFGIIFSFIRDNPGFNRADVNSPNFNEEYKNTMLPKASIEQLYIIIINLIENVGKLTSMTSMHFI